MFWSVLHSFHKAARGSRYFLKRMSILRVSVHNGEEVTSSPCPKGGVDGAPGRTHRGFHLHRRPFRAPVTGRTLVILPLHSGHFPEEATTDFAQSRQQQVCPQGKNFTSQGLLLHAQHRSSSSAPPLATVHALTANNSLPGLHGTRTHKSIHTHTYTHTRTHTHAHTHTHTPMNRHGKYGRW